MEGESRSFIKLWLTVFACLLYTYFISSKIPKGKLRLLSLFPVFFLFTTLPLSLSTVLPTSVTSFFITWLANFKLILFSFDAGPLASDPPKPLFTFVLLACFPIRIKQNQKHPNGQKHQKASDFSRPQKLPLNLPTKFLLFAVLLGFHEYFKPLHPNVMLVVVCGQLFLFIDIILGISNALFRSVMGLELEMPSDEPYFATSLQDFWGRRWNLIVTNALRHTVYKPVRYAAAAVVGPQWAPLPAVMAAFLVSGLMHELLFYFMIRAAPSWEVTWFFVLHGAGLVVEFGLKRVLGKRFRLHWAVAGPLTVGFVMATAEWLFFPPLLRNGTVAGAIDESMMVVKIVTDGLNWALQRSSG